MAHDERVRVKKKKRVTTRHHTAAQRETDAQ